MVRLLGQLHWAFPVTLAKSEAILAFPMTYCMLLDKVSIKYCQGRNEVRWRPGQEASLASPCSSLILSEANVLFEGSTCTPCDLSRWNAMWLKLKNLQPAFKKTIDKKPGARFTVDGTNCFWKWITFFLQMQLSSFCSFVFFVLTRLPVYFISIEIFSNSVTF